MGVMIMSPRRPRSIYGSFDQYHNEGCHEYRVVAMDPSMPWAVLILASVAALVAGICVGRYGVLSGPNNSKY